MTANPVSKEDLLIFKGFYGGRPLFQSASYPVTGKHEFIVLPNNLGDSNFGKLNLKAHFELDLPESNFTTHQLLLSGNLEAGALFGKFIRNAQLDPEVLKTLPTIFLSSVPNGLFFSIEDEPFRELVERKYGFEVRDFNNVTIERVLVQGVLEGFTHYPIGQGLTLSVAPPGVSDDAKKPVISFHPPSFNSLGSEKVKGVIRCGMFHLLYGPKTPASTL